MCIRDRSEDVPLRIDDAQAFFERAEDGVERAAFVEGQRRVGRRNLPAVSYTHLRAHETVLDLVCRLLLEKKNKTTKQKKKKKHNKTEHKYKYITVIQTYTTLLS